MPTARKPPSGAWRVRIYIGSDENKRRHYKSITCPDPSPEGKIKCERAAAEWLLTNGHGNQEDLTFGEGVEKYIADRVGICSPRTIMDYKSTNRLYLTELKDVKISAITQPQIQALIGKLSRSGGRHGKNLSPKTISNIHCLIASVLKVYRPQFALNTRLPKKTKTNLYIPSDEEMKRVFALLQGHELEIPVLLAAFGPMRRGEIAALRTENISGNTVHVCENMVRTDSDVVAWTIKAPKSVESDRFIEYPAFVIAKLSRIRGRVTDLNPNEITDRFHDFLAENGIHNFRFHDIRHWCASTLHAKGIPDAYIMQRGGWSNDRVLKEVYRHAMESETRRQNEQINNMFSEMYDTKYDTKMKEAPKMGPLGLPATGIELV